jgi:hypothetical protein
MHDDEGWACYSIATFGSRNMRHYLVAVARTLDNFDH